ncbi:DER1-domain-containing protein [Trametopsis cervina]|nr:DER1-domain-containing protein [Trametopsis cervina]
MSFVDELRKIPPVTRFLCASSLAVSLPSMLSLVSPYKLIFVKELVTKKWELWRVYTSFFLGGSGINYLFDLIMLYRNSNELEEAHFMGRSADYAWQLIFAAASILTLNIPLGTYIFTRPLLVCLTYLTSRLAPPGTQTSLFGLVTIPLLYFPYALIFLDLLMAGPKAAAASITGAIAGHAWWWGVYHTRALAEFGRAPAWVKSIVGQPSQGSASGGTGGVHVVPPRERATAGASGRSSGYNWGSGQRLGSD